LERGEGRRPGCGKRWTPRVDLTGTVLGQQRLGVGLVSLIATLRQVGRLPLEAIQWYLATVHQLHLSVGAVSSALQRVAAAGQTAVAAIQGQVQTSPVVNADETGWRESGRNRYVWTFSTPTARFFTWGGRDKGMVDAALGPAFDGVLVTDFYAAYNHYAGLHQRCWAHLLRAIHELRGLFPTTSAWPAGRHGCISAIGKRSPSRAWWPRSGWPLKAGLSSGCWPTAGRIWPARPRPNGGCAYASSASWRSCLCSSPDPRSHRTTTQRNAVSGTW
jgi:hypothetical protein